MTRFVAALLAFLAPMPVWAACAPVAFNEARVWRVTAEDPTIAITFLGHASFLIETPDRVRAVTDFSGVFAPDQPPDLVTMNHAHSSHFTKCAPIPGIGTVLHGWRAGPEAARL